MKNPRLHDGGWSSESTRQNNTEEGFAESPLKPEAALIVEEISRTEWVSGMSYLSGFFILRERIHDSIRTVFVVPLLISAMNMKAILATIGVIIVGPGTVRAQSNATPIKFANKVLCQQLVISNPWR